MTRGLHLLLPLLLATGACAAPRPAPQLSDQAVVLGLPLVRQDALYECGLASVSALCAYYGVDLPAERREELARLAREERGLSGGELRDALEGEGLEVFLFPGTLDREATGLYHHLDQGRPLLVLVSPRDDQNHYVLVHGYDPGLGNVVLLDPQRGQLALPTAAFANDWERARRFTLLALPRTAGATESVFPNTPPEDP